ncbi:HypC/HybG/HupF family hydrogenase formation chaperone [Beijerinckia indica]|uniref:Hydrogenase assembly chaperone hypC/hupF n=1 Tax=Beijerinckia indica subsp. indica (strain ATCC 9039 / DSM 1715 / NCIMB 8712) TaxID=395963 RepID=B2IJ33_BEII9|nr:HypC/HybG/HupF family hydrogenase formation chaperone [Beijerinckia indica]ACB94796.1 hydrogenase assembly chaperone hypC/hupF [Beijerinckia indica subsp. indica ATCC 9039]
MCIGIPMRIVSLAGETALCVAEGREEQVDLALLSEAKVGEDVLVFLGLARRVLDPEEAAQIRAALGALAALSPASGEATVDLLQDGFADLMDREPQLPPHLEAARAAGLEEG